MTQKVQLPRRLVIIKRDFGCDWPKLSLPGGGELRVELSSGLCYPVFLSTLKEGIMNSKAMFFAILLAFGLFATNASADWSDDFDTYANGSGLIGQGGWEGWGGGISTDAMVTNLYAHSGPNSVSILPTTDVIQQFSGVTAGMVIVTAWMYIPIGAAGEQYFILLDAYDHGGTTNHWALQLRFQDGLVESEFDAVTYPTVSGEWAELQVVIDLDLDLMDVSYNGAVFLSKPYTAGTNFDFTGVLNLACLDLFSNGGTEVYWDDVSVVWGTTGVEDTSWSQVKSLY